MLIKLNNRYLHFMAKRILCFGGRGNLGTNFLKTLTGYNLTSIDLAPSNQESVKNILVKGLNPQEDLENIKKNIGN